MVIVRHRCGNALLGTQCMRVVQWVSWMVLMRLHLARIVREKQLERMFPGAHSLYVNHVY